MENLENILESILFVNGDAVDILDITTKLDVSKADVKNAVKKLQHFQASIHYMPLVAFYL